MGAGRRTAVRRPATPPHGVVAAPALARCRAACRVVVANLATDNGWCWAYGVWYPHVGRPPAAPEPSGHRR